MGQTIINNKKDLLLLLLYSPGKNDSPNEPIFGRTRLIKSIFLFNKEIWGKFKESIKIDEAELYQFIPWNYGPFSKQIYEDLTFFILRGFISTSTSQNEIMVEEAIEWSHWRNSTGAEDDVSEYQEEEFRLTSKGEAFTAKLYDLLSKNQKDILKTFKTQMQDVPLRALLRYVYKQYPGEISKSLIADDILG